NEVALENVREFEKNGVRDNEMYVRKRRVEFDEWEMENVLMVEDYEVRVNGYERRVKKNS
ncbi:hypothetical protein, partial [Paenibacillus xylanexedens]|uniref:hypothetical protein n=1 Tax=Paenibacillus xylanexedens TaxID=528191 RepID=UPI00164299BE